MARKITYTKKIQNYIIKDPFFEKNYSLVDGEEEFKYGYPIDEKKLKYVCELLKLKIVPIDNFKKDLRYDKYITGLLKYYKSEYVLKKNYNDGVGYKNYIIELEYLKNDKDKKEIFLVNTNEYKQIFSKIFKKADEQLKDEWFKRKKI